MPEQDNTPMEKINLNSSDFSEGLDNNFGIEDTQLLASKDLQSFLMSDPGDIKNIEEEAKKEKEAKELKDKEDLQRQQRAQETPEQKVARELAEKKAKDDKEDEGKNFLDQLLLSDDKDPNKTPTKSDQTPNNSDDDTYTTLSRDLLRLGVFSKNSEEETEDNIDVKTPEQFLERFSTEKKKGAINILDGFLSQFGDDYRKMFDSVFVNGVKPQEYLQSFAKIEAIKGLDLSNEGNQERVIRAYYRDLKWDDAKIDARITKLKDYGDLEDEAKTYHEVLLTKETEAATNLEKEKLEETQKQKDKELTILKSYQRILSEKVKGQEIDGIPLTQKDSEEVLDYLTQKKYKLVSGELLSEFDKDLMELNRPENHEIKIKLGLLLRKKLDLTSIKKTATSKKSEVLFNLSTKNAKDSKSEKKEVRSFFA